MLSPVQFGELVKVTGGRDQRHRHAVAGRFAKYNKSLGMDAEHLPLYGDEYVAYNAPWDSPEETKRVDELRFRHKMVKGGIYGATRGIRNQIERIDIADGYYAMYREKLEQYLENPVERDAGELEVELDRDFPEPPEPKPVQFGEKIKVRGKQASAAAVELIENAEVAGNKATLIPPYTMNGDTFVLTQKPGETDVDDYDAMMENAKSRFGEMLIERGLDPSILAAISDPDSDADIPDETMAQLQQISTDLLAESQGQLRAFVEGARGMNAASILKRAAKNGTAESHVLHVNAADFAKEVEQSKLPVLVDFWAPWCGPCLRMGPVIEELADAYAGKLKVVKVNVDDNPALADRFGVQGIPVCLMFKNGEETDRLLGGASKNDLAAFVDTQLA